ncbi:hypothetical protein ACMD2_16501 [Ananas comosus]|uniref:IBH1-like N-terminal domain-containing protein n=1 Tax=Ananas comosus TaxID=4615 RepID=A0A199UEA9_ANACO|nr:hypothetical protein ACMD2_16501 [Ananas comosus]
MKDHSSFKQAFMKNMLLGLKETNASSKIMSLQERKNAIKLSADVAMAFARGNMTWTRAIVVANLAKKEQCEALFRGILGKGYERMTRYSSYKSFKIQRSRKILKRSHKMCCVRRRNTTHRQQSLGVDVLARRMVEKRTQVLRRLIPGDLSGHMRGHLGSLVWVMACGFGIGS